MKLATLEVRADDLPLLLGPGEDRRHASLEADEPLDVRLGTRVRWGRALYRVAPGGWERPISIIEEARFRAGFVDGVLASALGFGLVDLVEVALRHMDETLACLASSWPGGVAGGGDVRWFVGPGHVTQAEVNALLQAPTLEDTASRCAEPEAAVRALQWASCRASELKANSSTVSGLFGPVLAVNDGGRLVALPVGFLLDGIHDAVDTLTAHALQREGAAELWRQECRRRTLGVLAGRGALLALDAEVQGDRILAVELVDDGLLLAVDIAVAGVDGASIADAEHRLRHFVPGATYTTPQGTVPIAVRDEVLRLVVIHGTDTALFLQGDQAVPVNWMRIEDLRWIITQAKRPDDLAMFLRDWQGQKAGFVFSFGPFDAWEIWSANDGSLYRGGQLPDALYIEPHGERAEWIKHSDLAWLEEALRDVGVRGLAAWPTVDVDEDACAATISDRWLRTALRIVRAADSAVIVAVRYDPVRAERRTLESIANGLGWKFRHLQADLTRYAIGGVIRIEICHGDEPDATDVARDNDVTVMAIGDGIHEALAEDSAAVERMLGEAIAAAGPGSDETRDAFVAAWCAAPPGIAGDATSPPATVHAGLAPPHPSLVTAVEQRIAGALQAAGIEPGVRRGTDARNLESQHIYPILQAQLTAALAPFHPDDLLTEVLADLERVHVQRWLSDGHHGRRAALADAMVERGLEPDDVVAEIATDRSEGAILARTVALVVEEALRHPPAGAATPNAFERSTIYAVAHHLLHAGLRSETIHLGLTSSEIEITAAYEIEFHRVRSDVDLDELQYKRAAATMPVRPTRPVDADDDEPTSIVTKLPELAGIDAALCEALGFGIDALITVLAVLEQWMVDVASPIAAATEDEAVAGVTADLVAPIDEGEIRSALSWLTLSREVTAQLVGSQGVVV